MGDVGTIQIETPAPCKVNKLVMSVEFLEKERSNLVMANIKFEKESLPEVFDAKFAMDYFGFGRGMVYNLINRNDCGGFRIGRRAFFHRDTFLKAIENMANSQAS